MALNGHPRSLISKARMKLHIRDQ